MNNDSIMLLPGGSTKDVILKYNKWIQKNKKKKNEMVRQSKIFKLLLNHQYL